MVCVHARSPSAEAYLNGNQIGNHRRKALSTGSTADPSPTGIGATIAAVETEEPMDDVANEYPWVRSRDDRFTLALVLDVGEVLSRHGYAAPTGSTLVDLTLGLYRALHPPTSGYAPPV